MLSYTWPLLLAFSTIAAASPFLTDADRSVILKSIDNICGDTWCEGDSNWSFDALTCDTDKGCLLDLTMKPYDLSDQGVSTRSFKCDLPGFVTRSSLFETTSLGDRHSQELYDAVNECIGDIETQYGPLYVPVAASCSSLFPADKPYTVLYAGDLVEAPGIRFAIQAVTALVNARAMTNATCTLEFQSYFRDKTNCTSVQGSSEVCSLPSSEGAYWVIRQGSETSATVVYVPKS